MNGHDSRAHSDSSSHAGEASELTDPESIIYESRTSNHITVITPIAPKVLLAVTGSLLRKEALAQDEGHDEVAPETLSTTTSPTASSPLPPEHSGSNGFFETSKPLLEELGSMSEQLSSVLREEMGQMRWPEGA
jgi:hypothetical protein